MKPFKKFIITSEPPNNDLVSGLLWQLDIDGIIETDSGVEVFVSSSKNITRDDIGNILKDMISERLIDTFYIREETLEDKNWNEE